MRNYLVLCILFFSMCQATAMKYIKSDSYRIEIGGQRGQVTYIHNISGFRKELVLAASWVRFGVSDSILYIAYNAGFSFVRRLCRIDLNTLQTLDVQECDFEDFAIHVHKIYYVSPSGHLCWKDLALCGNLNKVEEHLLFPVETKAQFELSGDHLFVFSTDGYKFVDLKDQSTVKSFNTVLNLRDSNPNDYLAIDDFHIYLIDRKTGTLRQTFNIGSHIKDAAFYDDIIFFLCLDSFNNIDLATGTITSHSLPPGVISSYVRFLYHEDHLYCFKEVTMDVYALKTLQKCLSLSPPWMNSGSWHVSKGRTDLLEGNDPCYPLFPSKKIFREVWNQRRLTAYARACPKAFVFDQPIKMPNYSNAEFDALADLILTAPSLVINTIFDEMTPDLVLFVLMHHKVDHHYFSSIEWKYRRPTLFHHLCYRLWHQDHMGAQRLLIPLLILKDPLAEELYGYALGFGIAEIGITAFLKNQIAQIPIVSKPKSVELILRGPQLAEPHINIDGNAGEKK